MVDVQEVLAEHPGPLTATLTASIEGPKGRGLTGLCPTQLMAVSLNTTRGHVGGEGKGAMKASGGGNTFHCPLCQQVEG